MNQRKTSGDGPTRASKAAAGAADSSVESKQGVTAPDMHESSKAVETGTASADEALMTQKLQSHIGRHLQAMYDEVAQEPVPERLLSLLQELERKEKNG